MIIDDKCLAQRKVDKCEKCCRFNDCTNKVHTLFSNDSACLKLGYEILEMICYEFKKAWKKGYVKMVESISNFLRSEKPCVLTAEQSDGIYLLESLERVCTEEYGTLDYCHEKMVKKVKNRLKDLEAKRNASTKRKEKFELTNKINETKGEMNF